MSRPKTARALRDRRYGALRNWAIRLGLPRAAELLDRTLEEEEDTDLDLTKIAASGGNQRAAA